MKTELKLTALVVGIAVAVAPVIAKAQDERTASQIDTTVRLDRGGAVDLSLISGRIRVVGWDRPDVHIKASIESGYLDLSANSSRITLEVDESNDRRGRHGHNNVGEAPYDVSVPRGARLIHQA